MQRSTILNLYTKKDSEESCSLFDGELLVSNLEPIIAELRKLRKIFYVPSHSYQLRTSV